MGRPGQPDGAGEPVRFRPARRRGLDGDIRSSRADVSACMRPGTTSCSPGTVSALCAHDATRSSMTDRHASMRSCAVVCRVGAAHGLSGVEGPVLPG